MKAVFPCSPFLNDEKEVSTGLLKPGLVGLGLKKIMPLNTGDSK
jgi:hypothetical protein